MKVLIEAPIKLHDSSILSEFPVETLPPGTYDVGVVDGPGDYAGIWYLRRGTSIGAPDHVWQETPGFEVIEKEENA